MPTAVTAIISPIGGTITFELSGNASGVGAQSTISRAVSGQPYSVIYSGAPYSVFVDPGEQLPTGLNSGTNYLYQFTDSVGTVTVGPLQPAPTLQFQEYWLTPLLVRLIRNGIDNITLPNNTQRAAVFHDMPLNGFDALPAITITQDLFRQDAIGIGQNTVNPLANQNGLWTMPALVENTWTITVFAKDVQTREFYRDSLIGIFESTLQSVFTPLGQNVSHNFLCHNYQWVDDLKGISPGFYCCDMMVHLTGEFNITISGIYPPVTAILVGPTATGTLNGNTTCGAISGLAI